MRATDVVGANTVVSIISKVLVLIFILFYFAQSIQIKQEKFLHIFLGSFWKI